MEAPSSDERREILPLFLLPVSDYSFQVWITTRDHYCVSNRVSDGTGITVINNVTNIIITSLHLTLTV